jgi:type III secretion protein R
VNAATVALIALVPVVVLVLTSFVKLSIVLSLLRNALGTQDAPSSLVITGISLVLTMFVMAPVAIDMLAAADTVPAPVVTPTPPPTPDATTRLVKALVPDESAAQVDAVKRALEPLRAWLGKHAAVRDRETFVGLAANLKNPAKGDEIWVLAPAFLTTELREAFVIALIVFVPFLVIDLVVGLALAALGLANTSPQTVALPLKLLLFIAVDGWRLLVEALLRGYA